MNHVESFIATIVARPRLTILLSLLVVIALAAGSTRLTTVEVEFRNHFSESDPHIVALDQLEERYALSDVVLVAVAPREGTVFTRETLVAVEELTEQLWRAPYATRVDSISNYTHSQGFEDELIVESLIDDAASLDDTDIERITDIALGTQEIAGRFVSRDGRVAGLVVSIALPENRESAKREVTDYLYETVADAREKHASIDYHLIGGIVLNRVIGDAIDDETAFLGPIALGTMLLVALVLIRSIWGTLAIVLMIASVIPSSLGFAGWVGLRLFGESSAALFVLMAVAVAHSVHIIEGMGGGLRQGMTRTEAVAYTLRVNMWPVFLTSFTTAVGFLSLNFVDMPPFRVMGNIVAFGSMCAFAFSVTLLPALLSVFPIRARKVRESRLDVFDRLSRFVVSYRMTLLYSFGLLTVLLVAGIFKLELKENWLEVVDESYEFRQSADFLNENFPGVETYEYSLDSGREGGVTDTEYLEKVDAFAEWYRAQPEFVHIFSIADIMKRLNRNLHGDDPDYYVTPDNTELAAQYLLLYEFSLPVGRDLNNLIDHDRRATRATVSLKSMSSREKIDLDNRAREWLRENAPGMETSATGIPIVGAYSVQRNIESMLMGTFVAMGIVSLLLFAVFRSIRLGLLSLIPNFLPAAMAMGLWGYLVGEVGVPASVVTAIAFGIIVDDTIHFMTKYTENRKAGKFPSESVQMAFRSVGRALLTTTLVFGLGFMVFGASGVVGNQVLGLLVGITVIIALVADFLFLPPLLMLLDETKETSEEIRERLRGSPAG